MSCHVSRGWSLVPRRRRRPGCRRRCCSRAATCWHGSPRPDPCLPAAQQHSVAIQIRRASRQRTRLSALSFSDEWPLLSCRKIGRQQRHRWISLALRLSETVGLVYIVCLSHRVAGAGRGRTRRPAAPSACAATPRPSGSPCPNDDCQMSLRCQSSSVDRFAQEWLCSDIAPCAYTGRH